MTTRAMLEARLQQKRVPPDERAAILAKLTPPDVPAAARYVWEFVEWLLEGCGASGFGGLQVTWRDLTAWRDANALALSGWEMQTTLRAAKAFVRAVQPKPAGR